MQQRMPSPSDSQGLQLLTSTYCDHRQAEMREPAPAYSTSRPCQGHTGFDSLDKVGDPAMMDGTM